MQLKVKRLVEDAILPVKAHPTDSGFDLFANENCIIEPGKTALISTGIAIELPQNFEAQVRPRSGITAKTNLRVQLGTIDESYTGEIKIIVDNISPIENKYGDRGMCLIDGTPERYISEIYQIYKGDKLAQLVIAPVGNPPIVEVNELENTDRGAHGFGSTGV